MTDSPHRGLSTPGKPTWSAPPTPSRTTPGAHPGLPPRRTTLRAVCVGGCGGATQPAGPSLPGQGRLTASLPRCRA